MCAERGFGSVCGGIHLYEGSLCSDQLANGLAQVRVCHGIGVCFDECVVVRLGVVTIFIIVRERMVRRTPNHLFLQKKVDDFILDFQVRPNFRTHMQVFATSCECVQECFVGYEFLF